MIASQLPHEIEVKIIRRVPRTLAAFEELMRRVGTRLVRPRRLLSDRRFRLRVAPIGQAITVPADLFVDPVAGRRLLSYLGMAVSGKMESIIIALPPKLPSRVVRLRVDDKTIIWTVKEAANRVNRRQGGVNDWVEVEAEIRSAVKAEKLILALGYRLASARQKYRATYALGNSLIEWNQCPAQGVLPWLEIESPTPAEVFATARALGFSKADTAVMSEAEYLSRSGLSKAAVRHLVFSPESR